ncbi:alpha/beta hydrolase [Flavobacteriales bacterium]|nr:alpha/beta hydrolase [Flavobacteriales bacterium]
MYKLQIEGSDSLPIDIDLLLCKDAKSPLVIFCHGFKGFKDWGPFNFVANEFFKNGLSFLKFNFSHNGVNADDLLNFSDLETFGQNNFTKELYDLNKVIDWAILNFSTQFDANNIYLLGHSRGGGIALLHASEDKRIKKLVSWASVCDYKSRFDIDKIDLWKDRGVVYVFNSRTNQQMPLYYQFYLDFINNEDKLSISSAALKLNIPCLIVHGDEDTTVKIEEGHKLHNWISNSEFLEIKNSDHVFNSKHPFEDQNPSLQLLQALNNSILFLMK